LRALRQRERPKSPEEEEEEEEEEIIRLPGGVGEWMVGPLMAARALHRRCAALR
jgi:hypothetical protein